MNAAIQPAQTPTLFDELHDRKMFIVARADTKTPINPHTKRNSNAQDRATWLTPAEAQAHVTRLGAGFAVGIVLTAECGIACLDIDGAYDPASGHWSPLALELLAAFPGAYVEVSISGRGLHIIFAYKGEFPAHSCKNGERHIELYHEARFILLTGTNARGSVLSDYTNEVWAVAYQYFPPALTAAVASEWTEAPEVVPAEFVHAIEARKREFPLFAALVDADVDVLTARWCKASGECDQSEADFMLCCELLTLNGGNCQALLEYMQSGELALARPKWDERYLRRSIGKAYAKIAPSLPVNVGFGKGPKPAGMAYTPLPAQVPAGTPTPAPASTGAADAPVLLMNRKMQYEATLEALVYVLSKQTQASIGFDEFRGRVMIAPTATEEWRPLSDTDMIQLRETFAREQRFAPIGKELMADALHLVASRHRFDSAITWLSGLQWDGAPRIERFLTVYCGTADDDYARAVGLYIWTGLAGRVLDPGCQLDMVVAFQSPQGKMKSTGFQAMVPADDCFTDGLSLHDDNDDFKRLIRGKLLIEVAELAGLSKADINVVKRVITRRQEEWIEKFQTQPTRFKRRCMLFASTNEEHFLPPDETGQRRWVPVEVIQLDRIRIAADRDQLWAEGAARWRMTGVAWQAAERLAKGRHVKYEQTDIWESAIEGWLDRMPHAVGGVMPSLPPRARPFTVSEALTGAIGLNTAHQDAKAEKRAARVLRQLGFEVRTVRLDGISKPCKRWVPRA